LLSIRVKSIIVTERNVGRSAIMKSKFGLIPFLLFGLAAAVPVQSQSASDQRASGQSSTSPKTVQAGKKSRSAGGDVGSGSGDIGKGIARGAGSLASGTGKGAVDLVTLHPIDAAASVGKGGAAAGKNIAVGTTKGTGKIVKGVGKGIRHIF
jgi:hypothetical protein